MLKTKYKFNTNSLSFEKSKLTFFEFIIKAISYLSIGAVISAVVIYFAPNYIDQKLNSDLYQMTSKYQIINTKLEQLNLVLKDLTDRDNNIYRVVFEADPIPNSIRGVEKIQQNIKLNSFTNAELMDYTFTSIKSITQQMYVQSKSFDEIVSMAKNKQKILASIPAIMPINSKDLKHVPGGFGWRMHPIYKTTQYHPGMDFTAEQGTPIYATGDGVIQESVMQMQGYGYYVLINHGFAYQTRYAHMCKINAKEGAPVKRGDLIGYVGSTGLSTGPHIHYEVIKNGEPVNPVNFYYNNLTPEEYQIILKLSSSSTPSYD